MSSSFGGRGYQSIFIHFLVPLCLYILASFLFFTNYVCIPVSAIDCSVSSSEYNALRMIYNRTDGEHWNYTKAIPNQIGTKWHFPSNSSTPCTEKWYGVSCVKVSVSDCKITALSLESISMRGVLPSEIVGLTSLHSLNFHKNYLEKTIPESISNMSALTVLDLGDNYYGVPPYIYFPECIFFISGMEKLVLSQNFWRSTLPQTISHLKFLNYLDLANNQFFGNLTKEVYGLQSLEYVNLHGNGLRGELSTEVSRLSLLGSFDIGNNHFTSSLPSSISKLSYLTDLYLEGNNFNGFLPEELGNMTSLKILDLSRNFFIGPFSKSFSKLKLSYLNLYLNFLQGGIDDSLLTEDLLFFSIAQNNFSGILPPNMWFNASKLLHLDLGGNHFR